MSRKSRSITDIRCIIGLSGLILTIIGAIMIYVDQRKNHKLRSVKTLEYQFTLPILVPMFSVMAFVRNIPQLHALSLWVLSDLFPSVAGIAHAIKLSHYIFETKAEFAALVLIMIGMLLGLAPMMKGFRFDKLSFVPLIICGLMWLTSAIIFGVEDKDPVSCSAHLIMVLMVGLAVLLRSLSISLAVSFTSINIIIKTMASIISLIDAKDSKHAAAFCVSYAAAIIWVAWVAFDLHRHGVPDRLSHKKGWEKIN